jgi:hypothetical protein|tara:strand:- start:339 stop:707 length:369 start_codon:yes stop_codon:yes gene_type:complete
MKKNIIKYRNKFEANIGEKLDDWSYEPYHIPYVTKRKYIPDFTKGNILVEAKGYFRVGDTQKYKAIRDSLFSQELVFVLTNASKKVRKGSKITMGEWCEKEGFKWFTLDTLKELKRYGTTTE